MPIYEYRCKSCARKVSLFFRSFSSVDDPTCPHCGSSDLHRLFSRVALLRSEDALLEDLDDPSLYSDLDENDPRSVARWAKKMGKHFGDELGTEYEEMVEELERASTEGEETPDGAESEDSLT
jgi:putative FmdB family regulatory protein